MSLESDIKKFREAFQLHINNEPTLLGVEEMQLHLDLIEEELDELKSAWNMRDEVEVFDGIVDLIYVAAGLAVHMGLPLDDGWKEVHKSNMSKLDVNGEPIYSDGTDGFPEGKVLKGENYFPPRLDVLLEMASKANEVEWLDEGEVLERP